MLIEQAVSLVATPQGNLELRIHAIRNAAAKRLDDRVANPRAAVVIRAAVVDRPSYRRGRIVRGCGEAVAVRSRRRGRRAANTAGRGPGVLIAHDVRDIARKNAPDVRADAVGLRGIPVGRVVHQITWLRPERGRVRLGQRSGKVDEREVVDRLVRSVETPLRRNAAIEIAAGVNQCRQRDGAVQGQPRSSSGNTDGSGERADKIAVARIGGTEIHIVRVRHLRSGGRGYAQALGGLCPRRHEARKAGPQSERPMTPFHRGRVISSGGINRNESSWQLRCQA